MANDDHSLRKLQPDFVISPGTQVVVKVAKALPGGEHHKPAGSVRNGTANWPRLP